MKKKHCLAWLGLVVCAAPVAASCAGQGAEPPEAEPSAAELAAAAAPVPAGEGIGLLPQAAGLIVICHVPPGNPAAQQTLWVPYWAVPAHLKHGDHLGPCSGPCLSSGQACSFDEQCCSGNCTYGLCSPGAAGCLPDGDECSFDHQCCSGSCHYGVCEAGGACLPPGDECSFDHQCCSGSCKYGVCQ